MITDFSGAIHRSTNAFNTHQIRHLPRPARDASRTSLSREDLQRLVAAMVD
ncbi:MULTISPECIES: hypothetical protein [Novosphingobium]|uniref:hypothetical protein n=1 Tax=Novosphingobium TaxID=165696 RepID=UPI000AEC988D|nr:MULTISPECIES: hypothetical protein [unclassified Novosphingobium]WRT94093.1 hypothetical protein U9J33_06165 [Novosphingobium sp. RL4]